MNTLRELGNFAGIPQGSLEVAGFGGPWITSLGMVNLLVMERQKPASMLAIIQALQNLTPIILEAKIVGSRSGEEPFEPVIRLNASGGITWHTNIEYHLDGNALGVSGNLGSAGGDFTPTQLGPGNWQLVVRRAGISNTGFVSLSKTLDTITVSVLPKKPPPPVPPSPPPPPTISATTEGAGSGTVLVVSGSGFLPNRTITVRVADEQFNPERNFQQSSTANGELRMRISLPCDSGLSFHVSATDSRPGPGILGVVFSNNVKLLCP